MKNLQNSVLTITMAIGLAITGLTPAHASTTTSIARESTTISAQDVSPIHAASTIRMTYDKIKVTTAPAPLVRKTTPPAKPVDAPVEIVQPQSSESVSTVAKTVQPKAVVPTTVPATYPAPAPIPAPVVSSHGIGSRNAIVNAALGQLGVQQDCTALVSNSLLAVGIHFHSAPAGYLSLGHTVPAAAAQPGDLVYYQNGGTGLPHIAVYIGNGQAVHGGWEGGTTAIASVNIGSGPVFIRLG